VSTMDPSLKHTRARRNRSSGRTGDASAKMSTRPTSRPHCRRCGRFPTSSRDESVAHTGRQIARYGVTNKEKPPRFLTPGRRFDSEDWTACQISPFALISLSTERHAAFHSRSFRSSPIFCSIFSRAISSGVGICVGRWNPAIYGRNSADHEKTRNSIPTRARVPRDRASHGSRGRVPSSCPLRCRLVDVFEQRDHLVVRLRGVVTFFASVQCRRAG
jgi:hypothetical protein